MICLRVLTKVACDPNPDRLQVMQRMKIKYGYDGSGGHDIRLVFFLLKFEFVLLFYYMKKLDLYLLQLIRTHPGKRWM